MSRRAIALIAAILFVLSWIFPVGAGVARNAQTRLPQWWGTVDVALAFVVAVAALGIQMLAHGKVDTQTGQTTYRIYVLGNRETERHRTSRSGEPLQTFVGTTSVELRREKNGLSATPNEALGF